MVREDDSPAVGNVGGKGKPRRRIQAREQPLVNSEDRPAVGNTMSKSGD
jgi:hypothetical protein